MTETKDGVSVIYVTEFPNQFGERVVFHAFRNKHKAYNDAGTTGLVVPCVEKSDYDKLLAENLRLREALEYYAV